MLIGFSRSEAVLRDRLNTGKADADVLVASYNNWKMTVARTGASRYMILPLNTFQGLSISAPNASGQVKIDFATGSVTATVNGLPAGEWNIWLIHNSENSSTMPDFDDETINAGSFQFENGVGQINTNLGRDLLARFSVDRIAVAPAGQHPAQGFVLTGAPTLFERLLRKEEAQTAKKSALGIMPALFQTIIPTASADASSLEALVARGRQVFNNEKFNGNSRSCATCHPEGNNFTVDPTFIATLAPNNPLFVAEFTPALAQNFENPALMRRLGLFLENADGFDDLQHKFVMRAANNLNGISQTLKAADPSLIVDFTAPADQPLSPPLQRLGWGGDGAPGNGTLRDFAIGAVIQHFTKTLNRTPGVDFRLPTDQELDAMEAFQRSLGRQEELNLGSSGASPRGVGGLQLKNALLSEGKRLFTDAGNSFEPNKKNCTACHFNGGGSAAFTFSPNRDGITNFATCLDCSPFGFNAAEGTGTVDMPEVAANGLPLDGGFGRVPLPDGSFGEMAFIRFSPDFAITVPNKEFNSPSLIEAADSGPYFHHHLATTLEDAIAFYGTPAFAASGAGGVATIQFGGTGTGKDNSEVQAIGAFLRALNALDNIRSVVALSGRAQKTSNLADARNLATLALGDNNDAIRVLTAGGLATESKNPASSVFKAVLSLQASKALLETAIKQNNVSSVKTILTAVVVAQRTARLLLADPNTLPASFRN